MAESTLDGSFLYLFDNWPGQPRVVEDDGWDFLAAAHHNVSTEVIKLGTKVAVRQRPGRTAASLEGWSTFIYLMGQSLDTNPTCAAKQLVVPAISPATGAGMYQVTNDPDGTLLGSTAAVDQGGGLAGVMLSVMTFTVGTPKYGWFWCGGINPEGWAPLLIGNYNSADGTAVGTICAHNLTADEIGIGPCLSTETPIGWSSSADAG